MGTGRKFNTKPRTRPKKGACEKRRREKVHRKRLIGLGMAEAKVNAMNPAQVRTLLKRPKKIKAGK